MNSEPARCHSGNERLIVQKLHCPWCGDRPDSEFTYYCTEEGVAGTKSRKQQDQHDRIYLRSNHVGEHVEIWQHTFGCRGWLRVVRHNLTHTISKIVRIDQKARVARS